MSMILAAAKRRIGSHILIRPYGSNLILHHFLSSISNSRNQDPKTHDFKVSDYLISSFGFSPVKAAAMSKRLTHLKSHDKPEAVRHFLEHHDFSESEIKTIITGCPDILCSSVDNTLAPNLRALRNSELSSSSLNLIILSGPVALQLSEAVPRINYWRDFVAGDEADLVKVFKCNRGLISHDINRGIAKKLSIFKSHGMSPGDIRKIVCIARGLLTSSVIAINAILQRVKELDFQPGSRMFLVGLQGLSGVSREELQKKKVFFKSIGWSDHEFISALRKSPTMLGQSEETLKAKMDFLLEEVRCDISYVKLHPTLLTRNLEKRMRPRHHILSLLESKNLIGKRRGILSDIKLTDSQFLERYILPNKDIVSELQQSYLAACASDSR